MSLNNVSITSFPIADCQLPICFRSPFLKSAIGNWKSAISFTHSEALSADQPSWRDALNSVSITAFPIADCQLPICVPMALLKIGNRQLEIGNEYHSYRNACSGSTFVARRAGR